MTLHQKAYNRYIEEGLLSTSTGRKLSESVMLDDTLSETEILGSRREVEILADACGLKIKHAKQGWLI